MKKKKHCTAESNEESDDEESADEDTDEDNNNNASASANKNKNGKDNSDKDSNEDDSPYRWIGKWIQKPKGKRCQKSKTGCKGFMTTRLLKRARITKDQYTMYKVHLQFTFGHTADTLQKTAHWLIGCYFDITESYKVLYTVKKFFFFFKAWPEGCAPGRGPKSSP
jgi:hypothetical protein